MSTIKKSLNKKNTLAAFIKDPLWLYILIMCLFVFAAADNVFGYGVAILVMILSAIMIYNLYFAQHYCLHYQVRKKLGQLGHNYIILFPHENHRLQDHPFPHYILISPKGIFNIQLLEFSGILKGSQDETSWNFIDNSDPFNTTQKTVENPILSLQRKQQFIEELLEQNYLKYLFIQSILVIHNNDAEINIDVEIPIVKVKDLLDHLSQYPDRPMMHAIKTEIRTILMEKTPKQYFLPTSS